MIWNIPPTLDILNGSGRNTLVEHLDISFTDFGDDYLTATMPVNAHTVQPMRLLHGGASVAFAETLGSVASMLMLEDLGRQSVVGVEINANHLNSAREGDTVTGTVRPIKVGRQFHVWEIKIFRSDEKIVCISRITIAVVERR